VKSQPWRFVCAQLKSSSSDQSLTYRFQYTVAGGEPRKLGTGTVHHLSTEVAGGFTGMYFGMYATDNGQQSTTPAHFVNFEYHPG
jgi:xylan 1,4-beta-xylosidase